MLALYQQEPLNLYRSQVTSVSFRASGWFAELSDVYRDLETQRRQALWEETPTLYLPVVLRDRDPNLSQLYKQRKQR